MDKEEVKKDWYVSTEQLLKMKRMAAAMNNWKEVERITKILNLRRKQKDK